jgi:soluble lytic murein transglycosylase
MENKRLFAYSLITILCSSCGTTMLAPPNENFLNLTGSLEPNESDIYANKYHRANLMLKEGFKANACPTFEELSIKENFPLRELSLIKALESCNWTVERLINTWSNAEISPWLKEEFHKKSLEIAKKKNIKKWESTHNFEMSFFPKIKKEREAYIREALQIAEDEQLQEEIEKFNKRLLKISPRFIVAPKNEELYSIARDYERASEYKRAIETYESILRNKDIGYEEKIKSWKRITRVFKNMRRKDLANSSTQSLVKWINNNKELLDDQFHRELVNARTRWAKSVWTQGKLKLAKKILNNSLKKNQATKEQRAEIFYILANIAKEEKKLKSSIYLLKKSIPLSSGKLKEKILWQLGWIEYKSKNFSKSSKIFLELFEDNDDTSKYAYWTAISFSREKKSKESLVFFEKAVEIAPLGYYGLMARKKLGIKLNLENETIEPTKDNLYDWLISLGEYKHTKKYLDQFIYKSSNSEKVELLEKMFRSGNYPGALKTYFNMGQDLREEVQEKYTNYIYPKPIIKSKYLNSKTDLDLIYSIIRQESAFNKEARSFADAYGLMQIIPQRAKKLSRKHRIPYKAPSDLYNIQINTGLGSHYLNDLVILLGKLPMAIGSYNAGESAMKRWVKSRYNGDIEEFIEDVPYRETKKYIKLVLRNLEIYRSLPIQKDKFID